MEQAWNLTDKDIDRIIESEFQVYLKHLAGVLKGWDTGLCPYEDELHEALLEDYEEYKKMRFGENK